MLYYSKFLIYYVLTSCVVLINLTFIYMCALSLVLVAVLVCFILGIAIKSFLCVKCSQTICLYSRFN